MGLGIRDAAQLPQPEHSERGFDENPLSEAVVPGSRQAGREVRALPPQVRARLLGVQGMGNNLDRPRALH